MFRSRRSMGCGKSKGGHREALDPDQGRSNRWLPGHGVEHRLDGRHHVPRSADGRPGRRRVEAVMKKLFIAAASVSVAVVLLSAAGAPARTLAPKPLAAHQEPR